jgi:inner membrane protein
MTGKTHFGIGVISTVILSQYLSYNLSLGTLIICSLASLLPDIDHPKSIINQYVLPLKNKEFKIAIYVVLGVFINALDYFYFNNAYLKVAGIFLILIGISAHRDGITHSLTGLLCFLGVFGFFARTYKFQELIIPFAIGYGTHLLGDMFTNRGVPLLFPFKKKKFKMLLTYSVGSWWGNLLEGAIIAAGLIYLTFQLPVILTKIK